jgi:hypothetical protein
VPKSEESAAYTALVRTETGRRIRLTLAESTPIEVRTKAVALVPEGQSVDQVTVVEEGTGPKAAPTTDRGDSNV